MTIGILIAVCSILAGWFAGRYWELTVWVTRCRTALSILKAAKQQVQQMPTVDNWDCWNPSRPTGSVVLSAGNVVLYQNWPHLVIKTENQGLRLAAFQPPDPKR